ncbi:MAG TPA: PAS domain S-box protein, partial [Polyangiaceae bacterium]
HAALAVSNARAYAAEREAHAAAVRANEALARSNEAHRLLFDGSPQPLLVFEVDTLRILAANEAALRLFAYGRDELLQTRMSDLARDDHEAVKTRTAALGEGEVFRTRRYYRKDGTPVMVEFTSRALTFDGRRARITVIKDITERYESEQARALLAAIVQSSNDSMVSVRLDGTISSWNAAAARLFGYAEHEAMGRPFERIVPPSRREEELALGRRVEAGEAVPEYETTRLRMDGSEVPVSVSMAPLLDGSGRVVGVSRTARDLTEQRKAEQTLRRTEEQLRQAQKMEAVGRLAGGIAHDFNNMLSVILSYCAMLREEIPESSPMEGDLEEIRKAGVRAADLTRQLLVFSRQQVVEPKALDLNEILRSMGKMLERLVGEDVQVGLRFAPDLASIRADPSNVEQVIMNLVVNARDAMPAGGVLLIETANVELDAEYAAEHVGTTPGPHVMLAVSDTGVGMDRATQSRIFEPFFTTKGPGKGTGLGLATVFGIAQQCGGGVWVESEPGKGTTFKVYFPRLDVKSDPPVQAVHPVAHRGQETILLIEDEEQVRAVATGILKRSGYRVLVAETPAAALRMCRENEGPIDLLLTDVVMPQMSGAELAEEFAKLRPETRVLCMSGYTDDNAVRKRVLERGLAFLQKPFTPESLTRRVREVLGGRAPS